MCECGFGEQLLRYWISWFDLTFATACAVSSPTQPSDTTEVYARAFPFHIGIPPGSFVMAKALCIHVSVFRRARFHPCLPPHPPLHPHTPCFVEQSYGPVLVTGGGDSAVIIWEASMMRKRHDRFKGVLLTLLIAKCDHRQYIFVEVGHKYCRHCQALRYIIPPPSH